MLKHLYVDNYKSLVNFECEFSSMNLILGTNGAGKSTLFDVLRDVRDFVTGTSPVGVFRESSLTRWQTRNTQTFEIHVEGNGGLYQYHLEIEHQLGEQKQRIRREGVHYNGSPLYSAELGEVQLYTDTFDKGTTFSADWSQSGLSFLGRRRDNTLVTWLKDWFKEKLFCLQIDPLRMTATTSGTESELDYHATNFVDWYRHRIATDMGATIRVYEALSGMYEEFKGLTLDRQGGDVQHLHVQIGVVDEPLGKPRFVPYSFGDLSDGERALIALYTLVQVLAESDVTLCLDEPDNFIALQEIHPWLLAVEQAVSAGDAQALLISHHPEMIDFLARDCGLYLERTHNGPTRIQHNLGDEDTSLSASRRIARGWQ